MSISMSCTDGPIPYPDNLVRSGLTNMVNEARKLKSTGERPAFMGEAGYTNMLADAGLGSVYLGDA